MSNLLIFDEATTTGYAPIREGRDVDAFVCHPARRTLRLNLEIPDGGYYSRVGKPSLYDAVPIVLRQTAVRPIASRHFEPTYFRNSILGCNGLSDVPHEVTVAVLNSDLIARWYLSEFADVTQRSFPQIKIRNLQRLPMFDRGRLEHVVAGRRIIDAILESVHILEKAARGPTEAAASGLRDTLEFMVCCLYGQ